jgi:hypothetical protein
MERPHLIGIEYVLRNLRERDERELHEYGMDIATAVRAFERCILGKVFAVDDWPAAVVAFHVVTPRTVTASMMATEEWPRVARAVIRWGRREAKPALLAQGFARAECRTMDGHDDAIALLGSMGFRRECRVPQFGATGKTFIQFAWRINDHVPSVFQGSTFAQDADA